MCVVKILYKKFNLNLHNLEMFFLNFSNSLFCDMLTFFKPIKILNYL